MAEVSAPLRSADPALARSASLAQPGERGRLVIADRVVEKVALQAACLIEGVTSVGSSLERAVGWQFPRADARVTGRRVRVSLQIAVAWPAALPQVAAAVRQSVTDQISSLVGMQVDAVDVTAAKVVHVHPRPIRRAQ